MSSGIERRVWGFHQIAEARTASNPSSAWMALPDVRFRLRFPAAATVAELSRNWWWKLLSGNKLHIK
jgi:hypothetical protein